MDSRLDAVLTADLSELQLGQIILCLSRVCSHFSMRACIEGWPRHVVMSQRMSTWTNYPACAMFLEVGTLVE